MTTTIQTLTKPEFRTFAEDSGDSSMEGILYPENLQDSNPSFERPPMPLHHIDSMQRLRAKFLNHTRNKPGHSVVHPIYAETMTQRRVTQPTLLDSIPKEVLAKDILGFLTDKGVKVFFESLGATRINSDSFSDLRNQFCQRHGSRLEDPDTFFMSDGEDSETRGILSKPGSTTRCCPECHAEQTRAKRCHGCKVFYQASRDNQINKAFPGLWCQSCDRMAFCKDCLSHEHGGCGSAVLASTLLRAPTFGRKMGLGVTHNHHHHGGRVSCQNYCCPSVFTNTMCGEFVCLDCVDENRNEMDVEICEDCGKSTCLDPDCYFCEDFKHKNHICCKFSPEDAYNVDITSLSTKFKRNLSDCLVWILVLMALYKMWWFQKQQLEEEEL